VWDLLEMKKNFLDPDKIGKMIPFSQGKCLVTVGFPPRDERRKSTEPPLNRSKKSREGLQVMNQFKLLKNILEY